jgi:hypothetical protein
MLFLLVPVAYASVPITGSATKCTGLATCSYAMKSSMGSGWASTFGSVGGYVGQSPLYFSGGSVYFQLPGEQKATYSNGVYNGKALLDGYSTTAGTLYHVTGTFSAIDANTGTVVTGSTDAVMGIKGHSGRGGGNTYTLVSGTITLNLSTQRGSRTSLLCSPSPLPSGSSATCTVTVTDPGAGAASTPTGKIIFPQSGYGFGTFVPSNVCTLSSGTCAVTLTTVCGAFYNVVVTASYGGDSVHIGSSATQTIPISGDC